MTQKKRVLFQSVFYVLVLLTHVGVFYGTSWLLKGSDNLGAAIAAAYGLLFVAIPTATAILARFSLLKWYVDPFFAVILPAFLYVTMIVNRMERFDESLWSAVTQVSDSLCRDNGFVYLALMFVFGLLCSLSFARKREASIAYRLLSKKRKETET